MASPNIGDAIKQSVVDSFKNLDPLALMQKLVAEKPEDEESEEIRGKLQGVLKQYEGMSVEDQESFVNQMKEMLASKVSMKLEGKNIDMFGVQQAIGNAIMYRLILLGVGVLLLVLLFVFFGYKLYKSIKDKEVKREEKKKAKQMKKKK